MQVTFAPLSPGHPTATVVDRTAGAPLLALACASGHQCTGVDANGQAVTFDPSAPGSPTPSVVDAGQSLTGVACPSSGQCTAVDAAGGEVTFDPRSPGAPTATTVDPSGRLTAVACPSTRRCVAIDDSGHEVTFDPLASGTPSPVTVDGAGHLSALACPSTEQCTALDNLSAEVTFDPGSPGSATPTAIAGALTGLACQSTSQCTAVNNGGREITFDPSSPSLTTPTILSSAEIYASGGEQSFSVACPSVAQCTTIAEGSALELTLNPRYPSYYPGAPDPGPTSSVIDAANSVTAVACPSSGQCVAVDRYGDVVTASGAIVPANISAPAISAATTQGQTLRVSPGSWSENPTSYQYYWERCDADASNCAGTWAQGPAYTLSAADVGYRIRAHEGALNAAGPSRLGATTGFSAIVAAAPTGPAPATRTPQVVGSTTPGSLVSKPAKPGTRPRSACTQPHLSHLTLKAARRALAHAGCGVVLRHAHSTRLRGRVLRTSGRPGERFARGHRVSIVIGS